MSCVSSAAFICHFTYLQYYVLGVIDEQYNNRNNVPEKHRDKKMWMPIIVVLSSTRK